MLAAIEQKIAGKSRQGGRAVRYPAAALILLAALAGCRGDGPTAEPSEQPISPAEQPTVPAELDPDGMPSGESQQADQREWVQAILDDDATADALPRDLDPAWIVAVQRIDQLGGSFEFDANGRLVGIDLAGGRVTVRGADLQHLLAFPDLHRLRISSSDAGSEQIAPLASLSQLRELALSNSKIDADGLRELSVLEHLVSLDLQRSIHLHDESLAVLADFPSLEELGLVEGVITDAGLDHLQRVRRLRRLDLRACSQVTNVGLEKLAEFDNLRVLRVGGAVIDDTSLTVLAKVASLSSLTIEDASITDQGLAALSNLPLEDLSLSRCFGITDAAFPTIGQFSRLRQLYVRDILISGSELGQLASIPGLISLRLRQTAVGDSALDALADLPALRRLELAQTWITDEGLASIGRLHRLNHLDLEDNQLSDEGVQHLGALIELQRLSLAENPAITDAALPSLRPLPQLRDIDLRGTSVSRPTKRAGIF
jgi:Leucine-rich repeat (LRR) protein